MITSSQNGSLQPTYVYHASVMRQDRKVPLVVLLHTWSNDLEQRFEPLEKEIAKRGWIMIEPNFRGRNDHPEACGSRLAQQDILDAVKWVRKHYSINRDRIYLVGFSGGGYFTMLMAALYPKKWTAASAWCGISDLSQWYNYHQKDHYGQMMRQCFGGPPDQSDSIAGQYRKRSPITYLSKKLRVPLDIAAGRSDSIVPPLHSINAYNALVKASGYPAINKEEIDNVFKTEIVNSQSAKDAALVDPVLGRRIFLRRQEGKYRITIYAGIHEWVPAAAMQWLDNY